jgi:Cu(I)/Ag(I) efflux system membrane fusion protein
MTFDPHSPIPQPGSPYRRTAALMFVALAVGAGGSWLALRHGARAQAQDADPVVFYRNPMNPKITSPVFTKDEMGMDYIPVHQSELKGDAAPAKPADKGKIVFYRNPMDPKITSPVFTKDEMGMDYIPVYESELKGEAAPAVEGLATVKIDPDRQQLIGLTTATVAEGPVGGEVRTTARVAVDETRIRHIHVKVDGYVERLFVDFVGMPVAKGKPLFTFFSPDFVSAQEEYLLALKTQKSLAGGPLQSSGGDLLDAARRRLSLWDVPAAELAQLEQSGAVRKSLTLYSPITGVVTAKTAVEGMRLTPGDTPFELTDLSQVWGVADVYEPELPRVKVGMPAELSLGSFPGRTFHGRVAFIDPQVDPKSRTVKVRVELPNPKGELKPEMYGEMVLKSQARRGLVIPVDAVLDSGARKIVFVALGDGRFEPREVEAGANLGETLEIRSGLKAGDTVVTRASFLVDSESRLKAALAQFAAKPSAKP